MLSSSAAADHESNRPEFAWIMFKQPHKSAEPRAISMKVIDYLIQMSQPWPALDHVENFVLPSKHAHSTPKVDQASTYDDDCHFALYLGNKAKFGSEMGDSPLNAYDANRKFYLEGTESQRKWLAIPIVACDASNRVKEQCIKHHDTPYASASRLFNYPFSAPPLRTFAGYIDDSTKAPAHCASLTARILNASKVVDPLLDRSPSWFGPSTLYLELTKRSRMQRAHEKIEAYNTVKSTGETETVAENVKHLTSGSDQNINSMDTKKAIDALECLSKEVIKAFVDDDVTKQTELQQDLALALFNFSCKHLPSKRNKQ